MARGGDQLDGASGWGLEMEFRRLMMLGGIALFSAFFLGFCLATGGDDESPLDSVQDPPASGVAGTATPAGNETAEPTGAPTEDPSSDDGARTTRVGNIDLEVIKVLYPYDSTQHSGVNTANVRVDLEATGRGDGGGYFTAFELTLMDDAGAEHGASSCLDCPRNLDSLPLGDGEMGEGSAYFELPSGREPAELIYRGSASGEEGRIVLAE